MVKVNVLDFGVLPDFIGIQTQYFQKAIDYCFINGGGEVTVPAGTYITGDIRLRSNITLHLMENAIIKGSNNPKDYLNIYNDNIEPLTDAEANKQHWIPIRERKGDRLFSHIRCPGSYWNYGLVRIINAENVSVIGEKGSQFDGVNCYDEEGEEYYRGPHLINVHNSKNLSFSGYEVVNSGNWAHLVFSSQNIEVRNVTVLKGHDGVHFRACDNVIVENCTFKTGDDCVAGFDNYNVKVSDCFLSSACNVFRFGGRDILIENCTVEGPCEYAFRGSLTKEEKAASVEDSQNARKNTASFFTYMIDKTLDVRYTPGNIVVRNCTVKNADRFFRLNLSGTEPWQQGIPCEDILFENVKVLGAGHWITAYGNGTDRFTMKMKNIDFSFREGKQQCDFMHIGNYDSIVLENVNITNFAGDKLILNWGDKNKLLLNKINCNIENTVVEATEEFSGIYL